jgi:HAE1 family hydrophobic/amphiphilic exporter-1
LPQLTDVATDLQNGAYTAVADIDRDQAARFGIQPALIDATLYDAIGQRQVAQYYTQVNSYHVILEVTPALQGDPDLFSKIYLTSPTTGGQVPLSALVKLDMSRNNYLAINHQGQSPAVTLSFNLAAGASLGEAVDAVNALKANLGTPASLNGSFEGTAKAFQATLADAALFDRGGADRSLCHFRRAVRKLCTPTDHSVHIAVGGRGGAVVAVGHRIRS